MRGANSRPPVDIAWRLRNWAWFWTVKQIAGCSEDRLDALYMLDFLRMSVGCSMSHGRSNSSSKPQDCGVANTCVFSQYSTP